MFWQIKKQYGQEFQKLYLDSNAQNWLGRLENPTVLIFLCRSRLQGF
jgi:hypothetical protein